MIGDGRETGTGLVADPRVQAVGFTGSRAGGIALTRVAQGRAQPIPVYAEMSSVNPVILLPAALTLGAGQFCTNPGLILAIDGPELDGFVSGARTALSAMAPSTMLTAGIHNAYRAGVDALNANRKAECLIAGQAGEGLVAQPFLFATNADDLIADKSLTEEVFGATSLLVRCKDADQLKRVIDGLEGQLTVSVHASDDDLDLARRLLASHELRAGRVLFNGFGTGVEVCDAMVHGGPYPSTNDGRSTSVGSLAIMRFLRPICYQDVPENLLPEAVQNGNPWNVPQQVDGRAITSKFN